jgi:hypothetical protein
MKTIEKVLPVEDNAGDACLLRDGSPGVDLACVSFTAEAASLLGNGFLPTKVELFREELGR